MIQRDIIVISEYVISYFNTHGFKLTNLSLQKLMYFLEAIYMICEDDDKLYNDEFFAWTFGPVCLRLYNHYKVYSNEYIEISKDVIIPNNLKNYIENLFNLFHDFSAFQLVELSHRKGSPWYYINRDNDISENRNIVISKSATKKWFEGLVNVEE